VSEHEFRFEQEFSDILASLDGAMIFGERLPERC